MGKGKERPPVWIGHISLRTRKLEESETFMTQLGLRPIARDDDFSILELRGGTHIILTRDGEADPSDAGFDFMVEDIDATHADMSQKGFTVTEIERGRIHDSFHVTEPGGNRIVFNSTHVPDHDAV